jgi:hypothetical protein
MSLAGSESIPDPRVQGLSTESSKTFGRRWQWGAAPLFKIFLATQNKSKITEMILCHIKILT